MSDSEKHVTITERRFDAVHFTRGEIVVRERLLIGAICLIQACVGLSCDRDFSDPIRIVGHSYIRRADPAFSRYTIELTPGGCKITWMTDEPLSTGWEWKIPLPGHGGAIKLPGVAPLVFRHYATINYVFQPGVSYEFQASGLDADGNLYEGHVIHFQKYTEPERYQFEEAWF